MKIKQESFETMKTSSLLKIASPILNKYFKYFNYLGMYKEKYNSLAILLIDETRDSYQSDIDYEEFLEIQLLSYLKSYYKSIIKTEEEQEKLITFILNQSNSKIINIKNSNNIVSLFNTLVDLYGIEDSQDLLFSLLGKDNALNRALEFIFNNYKDAIINGKIEKCIKNQEVIYCIEAYCAKNDIEVKEIDYDDVFNYRFPSEMALYIADVKQYPITTKEEQIELGKRMVNGDAEARDLLINSNLRLVISVAKRFYGRGLEFMDLIQQGNIGLIKAADKYDPYKGIKFATYAFWQVRQSIQRGVEDLSRTIRIPVGLQSKISTFNSKVEKMRVTLGRMPTTEEISRELRMSPNTVRDYFNYQYKMVSINQPVKPNDKNETELGEFIPSKEDVEEKVFLSQVIPKILEILNRYPRLNKHAIFIITKRFNLDGDGFHTLKEIGQMINLTRERVRQIEAVTLRILKHPNNRKKLIDYWNLGVAKPKPKEEKKRKIDQEFAIKPNSSIDDIINLIIEYLDKNDYDFEDKEVAMFINSFGIYDGVSKTYDDLARIYKVGKDSFSNRITQLSDLIKYDETLDYLLNELIIIKRNENEKRREKLIEEYQRVADGIKNNEIMKKIESIHPIPAVAKKYIALRYGIIDNKPRSIWEIAMFHNDKYGRIENIINDNIRLLKQEDELREIIEKLVNIKEEENMPRKTKPLYQVIGCTKEELLKALSVLDEEEMELFKKRNGEDLDNPISCLTADESTKFNEVLRILKQVIKNPNYNRRGKRKNTDQQNVTEIAVKPKEEQRVEQHHIEKRVEQHHIEKKESLTKDDYISILNALRTPTMKELLETLPEDVAIITMLRLGYFNGKYFSTEAISKFLDVPVEYIEGAIQESLLVYKSKINSMIDKAISYKDDKKPQKLNLTFGIKTKKEQ